ncbi:MAG: group II intron reverse transcriptase domain-containing protein [Bacilli bacterium]|nr:group II intron reverse transcriptase domain-containing protein [Bacilli bacterium]
MLEKLINKDLWKRFLENNLNNEFLSKKEKKTLTTFVEEEKYKEICEKIINGNYVFSIPKKHVISKISTNKKRIVYTYNEEEMIIFKYLTFLLYDYDYLFSPNLYSFRKNNGVKNAIMKIKRNKNLHNLYGYKVDISNYFNSIDINILLNNIKSEISLDLYKLFKLILEDKNVLYHNEVIVENKGVMAGVPISSFLANYYIKEIDKYFYDKNIHYFRYADDILILAKTKDELDEYINTLRSKITEFNLKINEDKENIFIPNSEIEFLGFSFYNGEVDLSKNILKKIKGKIKRSARGLRRYMLKNNKSEESMIKAMIRKYNAKFYGRDTTELSWRYWFFPVITTSKSLKIIDNYLVQELRFIATGKHNKRNYQVVPYQALKELGYRSLVHEYYLFLNMKNEV